MLNLCSAIPCNVIIACFSRKAFLQEIYKYKAKIVGEFRLYFIFKFATIFFKSWYSDHGLNSRNIWRTDKVPRPEYQTSPVFRTLLYLTFRCVTILVSSNGRVGACGLWGPRSNSASAKKKLWSLSIRLSDMNTLVDSW